MKRGGSLIIMPQGSHGFLASPATIMQSLHAYYSDIASARGPASCRHHVEGAVFPMSQPSSQKTEGRASRAGGSARAETNGQPAALKQACQHAAARDGIHPLSRSFETLLKGSRRAAKHHHTHHQLQLQTGSVC